MVFNRCFINNLISFLFLDGYKCLGDWKQPGSRASFYANFLKIINFEGHLHQQNALHRIYWNRIICEGG